MPLTLFRSVVLALLCGLTLVLGSAPAFAHTRLIGSEPADGASVAVAPTRVSLTFNEVMRAEFSQLTVTGPDGAAWQTGIISGDGATVSIALRPLGPAGRYEVAYRVVSDDGHPVTGAVAFQLTSAGPSASQAVAVPQVANPQAAAPEAPAPAEEEGAPVWPWLLGTMILVGGGAAVALRQGRA